MSEITNFKLCDLVDKIKKKELSSKEITEAFINRSKTEKCFKNWLLNMCHTPQKEKKNFVPFCYGRNP